MDVEPNGGTFVIFRADQLVHEVLPAHAPRAALTVWMHGSTRKHASREAEEYMRKLMGGASTASAGCERK